METGDRIKLLETRILQIKQEMEEQMASSRRVLHVWAQLLLEDTEELKKQLNIK